MSGTHIGDRVIIVTGAASGFGRLLVHKAVAAGAQVMASDVDATGLDETVAEANGPGEARATVADVTDPAAMHALATAAVEAFGRVDVLVNNAGTMPLAFFADHAEATEAWSRCIDINFKGVVHGISAVHDHMIDQGRGHIINISSIYGNQPVVGAAVYGATKAAVAFVSDALRQESFGKIKVTTVRPTGVPGTNLGSGVINGEALIGILGVNQAGFFETLGRAAEGDPEVSDSSGMGYADLKPAELVDQIIHAIDQPWGVSISDITVRASGDHYLI